MLWDRRQTDGVSRAGHARGVEGGSKDGNGFFCFLGAMTVAAAAHCLQPLVTLLAVVEARAKTGDGDLVSCHERRGGPGLGGLMEAELDVAVDGKMFGHVQVCPV